MTPPRSVANPSRTVLVFAPLEYGYGRDIVRGVRAYATAQGGWQLRIGAVPRVEQFARIYRRIAPAGAVVMAASEEIERALLDSFVTPVVNVSARQIASRLPQVIPDNVGVGRRAAEHLLLRGFKRFAFAGIPEMGFSRMRCAGFSQAVTQAGFDCEEIEVSRDDLRERLDALPKPVGLLAGEDRVALGVIDACFEAGLAVPEQVAVLGVDNDDYICDSGHVSISSVEVRGQDVGFRAAELLDRLIAGEPPPDAAVLVECGDVVVRRSTDTVAVADPDLAFAVRYIRDHACDPLRVEALMEHLTIARRTLEKRFKAEFGRTLHAEIRRVQLHHARELLTTTQLPIPTIASRAGFCDRHIFSKVFRQTFGTPPGQYRDAHRLR